MNINRDLRPLLLGCVGAIMAGFALAGCDRDKQAATTDAPTNASAIVGNATNVDPNVISTPTNDAAVEDPENDVEATDRRHQQAMDHAEMRGGPMEPERRMGADASPQMNSSPPPMSDR